MTTFTPGGNTAMNMHHLANAILLEVYYRSGNLDGKEPRGAFLDWFLHPKRPWGLTVVDWLKPSSYKFKVRP